MAQRARWDTQLEGWLQYATLDNYNVSKSNQAAYQAASDFIDKPVGFLTLWGDYGPGKTHLAAAVTNALYGRAKYFTLPDLLSQLRQSIAHGTVEVFYQAISNLPVLVLDEIDKASLKDWSKEQAYRLFDKRYRHFEAMGTVLIMNESPHESNEKLNYLFSRMEDSRFACVELSGGDNRPILADMENQK